MTEDEERNERRAERARAAVLAYSGEEYPHQSLVDWIIDLLVDLQHLQKANTCSKESFNELLVTAQTHYAIETDEAKGGDSGREGA